MTFQKLKSEKDWKEFSAKLLAKIEAAPHSETIDAPTRFPCLAVASISAKGALFTIETLFFYSDDVAFLNKKTG